LPPYTCHSILNNLDIKTVEKSTRFISQGDKTDHAYIIKKGSCIILVEKNEELYPVDHKSEGDMLLMPALFTGEPVNSHIEAETNMELWVLKKSIFEKISKNNPGLWEFLIEIIAAKFDSKRPISDRTIGPYIATDIIGRGGYSIVYKGINSSTNQDIAIKMMRHHIVINPDFLEKFRNEAKIVTKFNHENIIKIFDRIERFQTVFIIMEYLDGKSIKELLAQKKRIPVDDAVKFLIQICKAIDYAYQQNILHKDINTENIMIINNDQAKLLDFGLACSIYDEDDLFDGALAYLAPEISQEEIANLQMVSLKDYINKPEKKLIYYIIIILIYFFKEICL